MGAALEMIMKQTVSIGDRTVEKYFDDEHFKSNYPLRRLASRPSNISYYKKKGWKLGQRPVSWFDPHFYLNRSPDVASAGIEPFEHYLKFGSLEGRLPISKEELEEEQVDAVQALIPFDEVLLNKISAQFDREFYVEQFPKCVDNHCDPILHYLSFGWKMGIKPNRWFDEQFYRQSFQDVADLPHASLIHFLDVGSQEGRAANSEYFTTQPEIEIQYDAETLAISNHFDKEFYNQNLEANEPLILDPIMHYRSVGWREARNPNSWFDVTFYVGNNSDVAGANVEPLYHFLRWGALEGRLPNKIGEFPESILRQDNVITDYISSEFDEEHYKKQKGVPFEKGINLIDHYLQHGEHMGLSPTSWFDPKLYVDKYLWGQTPADSAFYHYLKYGRDIGYAPSRPRVALKSLKKEQLVELYEPYFDEEFYESFYADLENSGIDMLEHFVLYGELEGRKPRADFDPGFYRTTNMKQDDIDGRPYAHYLRYGQFEQLRTNENSDQIVNTNARVQNSVVLRSFFSKNVSPTSSVNDADPNHLNIHFVVPDFSKGSGGHMTIFRIIKWLEMFGHSLTVWILNPDRHTSENSAKQNIH